MNGVKCTHTCFDVLPSPFSSGSTNSQTIQQMGQEVQVRISDINTDNNTVNLSMVPAGAYDDRNGGYGEPIDRQLMPCRGAGSSTEIVIVVVHHPCVTLVTPSGCCCCGLAALVMVACPSLRTVVAQRPRPTAQRFIAPPLLGVWSSISLWQGLFSIVFAIIVA